ncbi:MAG: SemiSWEET transporter [Bacteroidota bacterium]
MSFTQVIGIAASILTASSLIPQLVKVYKEKNADSVSLGMIGVLFCGLVLWVWYGVRQEDLIIIISNSFSVLVNVTLAFFALKYKKRS